ncbi:putative membrane protein [Virgibacillus halotolerans]|uniref:PTS transporter subunit IIC n=1 Tax=Virgibacillus halotolerans TaxID=1071053 RepID=UPI001961E3EB|nr:PTS sugar transporter subunit IIC [Virgibacillus halotolerans]MBM7599756.1 putative membrane protein [Virgibacillus halotolerans]
MKTFLQKKGVSLSIREYLITALSYMALGLFSSLIIGLIIETLGEQVVVNFSPGLAESLIEMGNFAMDTKIMGGAIGVAIAYGLKAPPLVLFSALFAGAFGAELGGPAGSYITALIAIECGKVVYKETKVDIIITPLVTIVAGFIVGTFIGPPINAFMLGFGEIINWSTAQQPLIMGILVAVLMGLALTAPISSAAIAIMLSLDGLAAGAATIGCAAQMIGFAVSSYRENGFGGFLAQGIGTSMLQVANILKKPIILLPPTIAGAVLAPFATVWLGLTNNASGAGMGTSGLVGQIMTFESMGFSMQIFWCILILHVIAPAIISLVLSEWFRKKGWIKFGDMKIDYE